MSPAPEVLGSLASLFTALLVLLFVPLYLTAMPDPVVDWVVRLFPPEKRPKVRETLSESRESLLGWLQGRLFSMVVVGVLAAIALYVIGVPGALFLGVFSGLVAFVPIVGSVAGAVPPWYWLSPATHRTPCGSCWPTWRSSR